MSVKEELQEKREKNEKGEKERREERGEEGERKQDRRRKRECLVSLIQERPTYTLLTTILLQNITEEKF